MSMLASAMYSIALSSERSMICDIDDRKYTICTPTVPERDRW
jgi:hypothetical protein